MEILHLTLKKKWFDMIASGEKKEEYREIKDYWINRLMIVFAMRDSGMVDLLQAKPYDVICFKNGYSKTAPTMFIEFGGVEVGEAKPEWSDNWQGNVFKIKLGKILQSK